MEGEDVVYGRKGDAYKSGCSSHAGVCDDNIQYPKENLQGNY
jgi:hypothetical protein